MNFRENLKNVLLDNKTVNFHIAIELSQKASPIEGVGFSFTENKEDENEPFGSKLGYISLDDKRNKNIIEDFKNALKHLISDFESDIITLSNLYILATRANYTGDSDEEILQSFISALSNTQKEEVYKRLVEEINKKYYRHKQFSKSTPKNVQDWLDLFNNAQYLHSFNDISHDVLQLINEYPKPLQFKHVKMLAPILRASLYHDFEVSEKEVADLILNDPSEINYLVAVILDTSDNTVQPPVWLNELFIDYIFKNNDNVAQYVIYYLFGFIRYESKRHNPVYVQFKFLMQEKLKKVVVAVDNDSLELIKKLKFTEEFLSFLNFLNSINMLDKIHETYFNTINEAFINALDKTENTIPDNLSNSNFIDQFKLYYLDEKNYRNGITILSLSLLHITDDQLKSMNDVLYRYKPLFFGGYEAKSIAINFSEFLLLTLLAIENVNGLNKEIFKSFRKLLDKFINNILYPFVLEIEKDDYLWDVNSNDLTKHSFSKFLINLSLKDIGSKNSKYKIWDNLYVKLLEYKTAQWPFERQGFNEPLKTNHEEMN